jgi:hypothetical protein
MAKKLGIIEKLAPASMLYGGEKSIFITHTAKRSKNATWLYFYLV